MPKFALARHAVVVAFASLFATSGLIAQDPVSRELMRLEDQWGVASIKRDGAAVGKLLSDDFLSFTDKGVVSTKATIVKNINSDTAQYVSGGNTGYQVKLHGSTGVIIGVWTATTKGAKGNVVAKYAWTDTWMKQADGKWLCIASQSTLVK
jgi:ketosteroid isomerase-like protein